MDSKRDQVWYALTKENYIDWFTDVEDIAKGEGKYHVLSQTCTNYSSVEDPEDQEKQHIDPTRKEAFEKDSAWFSVRLRKYISQIDKDKIRDVNELKEAWELLRKKYQKVSYDKVSKSIKRLTNFKLDETKTIEDNWVEIHEFRRIAQGFEKGWTCSEAMMLRMFIDGLSKEYDVSKTTLNASNYTTDQKIEALQDEWDKLNRGKKEKAYLADTMLVAKHVGNITLDPRYEEAYTAYRVARRGSPTNGQVCFTCDSKNHFAQFCPYRRKVWDYAKKLREEAEGTSDDHGRASKSSNWRSQSPEPDRGHSNNQGRGRPGQSNRDNDRSRSRSQSSRPQSRVRFDKSTERSRSRPDSRSEDRKQKSYSAAEEEAENSWTEEDDDSIEEFAGISWQQRSEIPHSDWIGDTGCTSPMTDKPELFSSPLIPCRRRIKVGGGLLYSVSKGTAQCKLKDGTSIFFPDSLLVPELGCNLMSARKICSRE